VWKECGDLVHVNGSQLPVPNTAERQALPARAGFGGKNHQTPNPPLGLNPESVGNARTCSVHAMLGGRCFFASE